jgi:DNA-binding SARP family transcriptional activator
VGLPATFRVLGPLEVDVNGSSVRLGSGRQRAVLGILLLNPNRVVSVDTLIEGIWGEGQPDALATLQVHMSKLRSTLGSPAADLISSVQPGYRISATAETLDLLKFENLRERGDEASRQANYGAAAASYKEALALWRGTPLSDLLDVPYLTHAIDRLELLHLATRIAWIESEVEGGRHESVLADLVTLSDENPLDEQIRGLRAVALYRCGRQADALEVIREARHRLGEELGLELGPELAALEDRILLHDPALMRSSVPTGSDTIRVVGGAQLPRGQLIFDDRRVALDAVVSTIGRAFDRTIVLAEESVSRRHAEIRRVSTGFVLIDLGSTNGTTVNGQAVSEHRLRDQDQLSFGSVTARFESDSDLIS